MTDENLPTPRRDETARHLQLEVRAQKLLALIESRCAHIQAGSRQANQAYFDEQPASPSFWDAGSAAAPSSSDGQDTTPTTGELSATVLNRYTRYWKTYLPGDPELRATLIRLVAHKYPLHLAVQRRLQTALGFDDPLVQSAYQALYEQPLESLFQPGVDTVPAGGELEQAMSDAFNQVVQEWDLAEEEEALEWVTLPSGGLLYQEGDPGDALFILISGRLRVAVAEASSQASPTQLPGRAADPAGPERTVREIGRGEMVGAMEALTGEPRTTRVYAIRDSELVRISQENLQRLSEKRPQVMRRMVAYLASRLKDQITPTRKGANSLVAFALLRAAPPAGGDRSARAMENASEDDPACRPAFGESGARSPLAGFSARFAQALSSFGPTLLLNSELLDCQTGPGWAQTQPSGEGNAELSAYLSEQESHYRYIVYEADAGLSPWSQRCLRQADRALVVADAREAPGDRQQPGALDDFLEQMQMPPAVELVLVHPAGASRPTDTRRWLEGSRFTSHYHLRDEKPVDLQRLVRRLTGRALGLVLSGGGARGFAHIGVLQALQVAGLSVDVVGGTSMGSVVGALYAMDYPMDHILNLVRQLSSPSRLFDPTLPLVSFFKSGKVTEVLKRVFGDTHIEDLWRPYFCLSTNLTRARERIHLQGLLWQAVRASSAIPGVFSPVLDDGELLVDGAVLNNLPVDVMQDFAGCGPIVGVNVFPEVDLVREYDFGHSVSGWEVLLRKLNPFAPNPSAPLIFESILRVIALNDVHLARAKSQMCELYINPPVEQFGILEFKSYKPIIEIGYRSGMEAIEAWSKGEPEAAPAPITQTLARSLEELELALDKIAVEA